MEKHSGKNKILLTPENFGFISELNKRSMKKYNIIIKFFFFLISFSSYTQEKKDWFFGAEIGNNNITSIQSNKNDSFQGGILAEYYFAKNWSLLGRIKYFKTGVSFNQNEFFGMFDGAVISIPVDIKWEYSIFKNLKGNLKTGVAYNQEIKSNYTFSEDLDTNYSKKFFSLNIGIGISYLIKKNTILYIDYENYSFGGYKGNNNGFIFKKNYYTENSLLNVGIKYNFKK